MIRKTEEQQPIEKHPLESLIGYRTKILTNDGRVFIGTLKGLDQALNCILSEAEERIYSETEPVKVHQIGTYFVRGDGIVVMGEFLETEEQREVLHEARAKPLNL